MSELKSTDRIPRNTARTTARVTPEEKAHSLITGIGGRV